MLVLTVFPPESVADAVIVCQPRPLPAFHRAALDPPVALGVNTPGILFPSTTQLMPVTVRLSVAKDFSATVLPRGTVDVLRGLVIVTARLPAAGGLRVIAVALPDWADTLPAASKAATV